MNPRMLRYALVPLPFGLLAAFLTASAPPNGWASSPSHVQPTAPFQARDAAVRDGDPYDSILQFIDAPWPDGGSYFKK